MTLISLSTLLQEFTKANLVEKIRPPPDCPRYRLSEVVNLKKGKTPTQLTKVFNENLQPYINIKAFEQGIIEYYVQSNDGVAVNSGDLVMVWDGARCGLVGRGQDGILGSTLKKISLKEKFAYVPISYLQYFLEHQYTYLNRLSRGSVIQHVDPGLFDAIQIPIPAKGDVHFERACSVIECLENVEAHIKNQLHYTSELKRSILALSFDG